MTELCRELGYEYNIAISRWNKAWNIPEEWLIYICMGLNAYHANIWTQRLLKYYE